MDAYVLESLSVRLKVTGELVLGEPGHPAGNADEVSAILGPRLGVAVDLDGMGLDVEGISGEVFGNVFEACWGESASVLVVVCLEAPDQFLDVIPCDFLGPGVSDE